MKKQQKMDTLVENVKKFRIKPLKNGIEIFLHYPSRDCPGMVDIFAGQMGNQEAEKLGQAILESLGYIRPTEWHRIDIVNAFVDADSDLDEDSVHDEWVESAIAKLNSNEYNRELISKELLEKIAGEVLIDLLP